MLSDEFLNTARRLATGTSEGDWRSAISRAYYACYHYFLDWLKSHGLDLSGDSQAHLLVYRGLNNCGIASVVLIAERHVKLHDARNDADYEVLMAFSRSDADEAVQQASDLLDDFEAELLLTTPATIAAGVRAYFVAIGRIPP